MKPAFSVIFLTTLIGAGQGLFLAYYSAGWLVMLNMLPAASADYSALAAGLSFALMAAGLVAGLVAGMVVGLVVGLGGWA